MVGNDAAGGAAKVDGASGEESAAAIRGTTTVPPSTLPDVAEPAPTVPPELESSDAVVPETTALSDEDRRAIEVCQNVVKLQEAGVQFATATESGAALTDSTAGLVEALRALADVAPPDTRAILEPVVTETDSVARTAGGAQATIARVGEILGRHAAAISAALRQLMETCPGQLDPADVDQAERLQLGHGQPT